MQIVTRTGTFQIGHVINKENGTSHAAVKDTRSQGFKFVYPGNRDRYRDRDYWLFVENDRPSHEDIIHSLITMDY